MGHTIARGGAETPRQGRRGGGFGQCAQAPPPELPTEPPPLRPPAPRPPPASGPSSPPESPAVVRSSSGTAPPWVACSRRLGGRGGAWHGYRAARAPVLVVGTRAPRPVTTVRAPGSVPRAARRRARCDHRPRTPAAASCQEPPPARSSRIRCRRERGRAVSYPMTAREVAAEPPSRRGGRGGDRGGGREGARRHRLPEVEGRDRRVRQKPRRAGRGRRGARPPLRAAPGAPLRGHGGTRGRALSHVAAREPRPEAARVARHRPGRRAPPRGCPAGVEARFSRRRLVRASKSVGVLGELIGRDKRQGDDEGRAGAAIYEL